MDDALAAEQRHLDVTYAAFDALLTALRTRERVSGIDEFANEALELMRRERVRMYTESSGPLYFGRIDAADGQTLYIGRHAVADPDNRLLAINWRTPAAERFYVATPQEPHGVRRRRRLDIEARAVVGFVDEELAGPEASDHLNDAIVEDISRQRVGEMRQIISTITPDQYELIAAEAAHALVIQGGPGTGKTAVGLHRAAWLLYRNPELARNGVLVVGPNDTFIRYISQVLPSLGERSVEQRPIGSLISTPHREVSEDRELAALKGDARMAAVLSRLLWERLSPPSSSTTFEVARVTVVVTAGDVRELVGHARSQRRAYQAGRELFRDRLASLVASRVVETAGPSLLASPGDVATLVRKTREYSRLADTAWPRVAPDKLYESLFKNRRRLGEAAAGLLSDDEVTLLLSVTPPAKRRDMTPTDVALLDEARWLVEPDLRTFGHVVVDEAQNLTAMELRMIVRRARGQSLTILGDIAQRTADAGLSTWERVLADAGVSEPGLRELLVSYRVPDDFLRLAALVRDGRAAAEVPRGIRSAPRPAFARRAPSAAELPRVVAEVAARLAEEVGSVGVVVPAARFADFAGLGFADARRGDLTAGVNLLDLHVVKGLEFDAAVVVEPGLILSERPDGGPGGLYTALTRSTRALAIVHADALPPALATAPDLHKGDSPL